MHKKREVERSIIRKKKRLKKKEILIGRDLILKHDTFFEISLIPFLSSGME